MVSFADKFEQKHCSSRVDDLKSIWWHLISFVVERDVHILHEKGERVDVIEELPDFIILDDLEPVLLLFAEGGLPLVCGTTKAEVLRVGAPVCSRACPST